MQTFLPYASFIKSAQCLDDKRLGKQRVECLQILKAIKDVNYGWRNHPATKMWTDYPHALEMYMNACIDEWVARGFKNTMEKANAPSFAELPNWIGNAELHASHRSNLLRKDTNFYKQYNWKEDDSMPYYWCGYSKQDKLNYAHLIVKENGNK
jgi:hypothetical protein